MIHKWDGKDIDKIYDLYFDTLQLAVKSEIFDVIAHPDVIKVFGHKARKDMSQRYEELAKSLSRMHLCAEVSTAGLRKPVGEIYPAPQLMEYFKKYNVPIILNSDAHIPEDVGKDFDKALQFIKSFGYREVCYLTKEPENNDIL